MYRYVFIFLLLTSCTINQKNRLEEHLATPEKAFDLRNMHFALEVLDDPAAPFSLTLEPLQPITNRQKSFPIYALKADGLPLHERFLLVSIDPLKMTATPQFEFEALENREIRIITAKGDEITEEAPVILKDFLKGQTIWLAAISKDKQTCNIAHVTPSPIESSIGDADFSLLTTHRKGTHFQLQGKGLTPGESVLVTEPSMKQQMAIADENGTISVPIDPIILGQLGGQTSVTIMRQGIESTIAYSWGSHLENESRQEALFQPIVFVANRDPKEIDLLALQSIIDKKLFL